MEAFQNPPIVIYDTESVTNKVETAVTNTKLLYHTKDRRVRFAETTKQDQRAPIKMVSGRAWSPGIYRSLRLLGKSLDVAWERAFIRPLTFNY